MKVISDSEILAEQALSSRLALAGIRQGISFNLDKCVSIGVFGFTRANKIKRLQCSLGVLKAFQSKLEAARGECSGDISCEETINNELQSINKKIENINRQLNKLKNK
jgi:hypothetical protein